MYFRYTFVQICIHSIVYHLPQNILEYNPMFQWSILLINFYTLHFPDVKFSYCYENRNLKSNLQTNHWIMNFYKRNIKKETLT